SSDVGADPPGPARGRGGPAVRGGRHRRGTSGSAQGEGRRGRRARRLGGRRWWRGRRSGPPRSARRGGCVDRPGHVGGGLPVAGGWGGSAGAGGSPGG